MIISTKLQIPQVRGPLVKRPRLTERLEEGFNCKLTVITAPPGYGKTTLLSDWTANAGVSVAWVSLDARDNDLMRFWMYTFAALKSAVPAFASLHTMNVAHNSTTDCLIALLINCLHRLSEKVIIVWDDFHHIENDAILSAVNYMLSCLPNQAHLYVTSRTQLPLPLSRWRANGELNELNAEDLRFSPDESNCFFERCSGLSLSPQEMSAVLDQTEGWIAGMRMAALSLSRASDRAAAIREMTGRRHDYAGYFFEEVLSHQSQERVQFLLQTSILGRMNPWLCEAVTGLVDCSRLLQELEQDNLFLVPLDGERTWYRYHRLFQQYLRKQLQTSAPESVGELHAAAGRWFRDHGYEQEAVEHYLACADYEAAMEILEQLMPKMKTSEWATLHKWLDAIPDTQLFHKPVLFLTRIASLYLSGRMGQAIDQYGWAVSRLNKGEDMLSEDAAQTYAAGFHYLTATRAYLERDFETSVKYWEKYLASDPKDEFISGLGMDVQGYHPLWDVSITSSGLRRAEKVLNRLIQLWSGRYRGHFTAHLLIEKGKLLYEWNRLEQAEQTLREALELVRTHGNASLDVTATLWIARIHTAQRRPHFVKHAALSPSVHGDAPDLGDASNNEKFSRIIEWSRALRYRMLGDIERAARWLDTCGLRPDDEIPCSMIAEYDLFACLLAERGRMAEAAALTERLLYLADREGLHSERIRILFHKSLLLARQGSLAASFDTLEEVLSLAEPDGYVRTFLDEGEPAAKLLAEYLHVRQNNHRRPGRPVSLLYVKRLLQQMGHEGNEQRAGQRPHPTLTAQETAVLTLISAGLSNQEIAKELSVSLPTVKTHIRNLYHKLGANNRVQAVEQAKMRGYL